MKIYYYIFKHEPYDDPDGYGSCIKEKGFASAKVMRKIQTTYCTRTACTHSRQSPSPERVNANSRSAATVRLPHRSKKFKNNVATSE